MNTTSQSDPLSQNNPDVVTVSKAELHANLNELLQAAWREGLVFSALLYSVVFLLVSFVSFHRGTSLAIGLFAVSLVAFVATHNRYTTVGKMLFKFCGYTSTRKGAGNFEV